MKVIVNRRPGRGFLRGGIVFLVPLIGVVLLLSVSCATTGLNYGNGDTVRGAGVWHRVQEGQTLWRIAKTYRISLEEIKESNDIEDMVHVAKGTWLFIPDADKVLYVQGTADGYGDSMDDPGFIWPIEGEIVGSYGKSGRDFNYGIDIKSARNQNVVASLRGTVVLSGTVRGYGTTIIIEHENDFCSLYSSNIQSLVREGQKVEKKTVIARARIGTGTADTAATLGTGDTVHYELFLRGKPVNPLYYLP